MEHMNRMILSGDYRILLDAIKGYRNGFVYGVKVRAPHSLVMNLLWSRGPIDVMAKKIVKASIMHGSKLAQFAFVFKMFHGLLSKLSPSGTQEWHAALIGGICGALFWGDHNPIVVQVNMYVLSRILSGFLFHFIDKYHAKLPSYGMRLYAFVLWASMMYLFYHSPKSLQHSLQSSMSYIYRDSDKYSNLSDLLIMNKPDQV